MSLSWPVVAMALVGALLHAAHLAQVKLRNKAIRFARAIAVIIALYTVIDAKGARVGPPSLASAPMRASAGPSHWAARRHHSAPTALRCGP